MSPLRLLLGASVALVGVAGCTRGHTNDASAYCEELKTAGDALAADIGNTLDIAPRVSLYERLRDISPLEVEEDWQAVIDLVNAAATVDLTDQVAVVAVQDQAFATARSAQAIVDEARALCGIELPAVGQLAPSASVIAVPETTTPETTPPAT